MFLARLLAKILTTITIRFLHPVILSFLARLTAISSLLSLQMPSKGMAICKSGISHWNITTGCKDLIDVPAPSEQGKKIINTQVGILGSFVPDEHVNTYTYLPYDRFRPGVTMLESPDLLGSWQLRRELAQPGRTK